MKYVEPNDMDENVKILYNLQNSGISVARGATLNLKIFGRPPAHEFVGMDWPILAVLLAFILSQL